MTSAAGGRLAVGTARRPSDELPGGRNGQYGTDGVSVTAVSTPRAEQMPGYGNCAAIFVLPIIDAGNHRAAAQITLTRTGAIGRRVLIDEWRETYGQTNSEGSSCGREIQTASPAVIYLASWLITQHPINTHRGVFVPEIPGDEGRAGVDSQSERRRYQNLENVRAAPSTERTAGLV
ncbi:hypothetical protein Bbelb_353750 [Branchiostoma belcheri]|nr:hypothetical protein Bbelb_353750 [Branchiostoma belcheri]